MFAHNTQQVVSYEAPEVVVTAKEDVAKHNPTRSVVVYGGVVEQSSSYDLLWTQVGRNEPPAADTFCVNTSIEW